MTSSENKDRQSWTLADQIAFECALANDEREDWQKLKNRDQLIAKSVPDQLWDAGNSRRRIAKLWLAERLLQAPSIKQASDSIRQSVETSGLILCIVGCLFGISAATVAVAYTGEAPINVSVFFGVFILLQALLAFALLIPFLLPNSLKERLLSGPLFRFAGSVFNLAFKMTQTLANRFLEAQNRNQAAEIAGVVRARFAIHQRLIKWLAFSKLQAAALCFNLGALIALLVAVAFSDRAFGWQTTLDVSAESIHGLVRFFATPWAWFYGEGDGYPSFEDVEGSRIVLKEGIRSLRTDSLVSWWPFLSLGMCVYGILPRLLFRILGGFQLCRSLQRYDFKNAASQRLFDRLAPIAPRFNAATVDQSSASEHSPQADSEAVAGSSHQTVTCLLEKELVASIDLDSLQTMLASQWNLPVANVKTQTYEGGTVVSSDTNLDPETQYALVFESWMPPIVETGRLINELRSALDNRTLIRFVLLGIPDAATGNISLQTTDSYRSAWDSFARRLGDPYLILDTPAS